MELAMSHQTKLLLMEFIIMIIVYTVSRVSWCLKIILYTVENKNEYSAEEIHNILTSL